jgi:DNA-binding winged helix-turn-helix (wHTH) protein
MATRRLAGSLGVLCMATKTVAVFQEADGASMVESEVRTIFQRSFASDYPQAGSAEINQSPFEGFRVALIPLFSSEKTKPARGTENVGTNQMFVLPLTWEQLMAKVQKGLADAMALQEKEKIVRFAEVTVDIQAMDVCRCNRPVPMTALEFKLLRYFVKNPNRAISRDDLLDEVWGYQSYPCTRTVDNHVMKLRQKLELDATHPRHFRTVHGVGYKFTP